jgi:asparaginyl-tRNA synthetase
MIFIKHLLQKTITSEAVVVKGWLLTKRSQKEVTFINMNDGSCPEGLQLVLDNLLFDNLEKFTIGCSLEATGIVVETHKSKANISVDKIPLYEMQCSKLILIGDCDIESYPFAKTRLPLEYLRKFSHIRGRTSTYGSIFRLRSAIMLAMHQYLGSEEDFLFLNPPIITRGDCEGGGGVFQVTEKDLSMQLEKFDWNKDHFSQPVYLTVSSQLQLEALACSLGRVYTTNKSFRAEHSSTHKHLSEFEHLEVEACFINLSELMDLAENFIKYIAKNILTTKLDDIKNLEKFVSPNLSSRLEKLVEQTYIRSSYDDAIKLLLRLKLETNIVYGMDLNSEMENALTTFYNSPVFVYDWPFEIKAFYMKQSDENLSLCKNFDLLMPYKVGELIGGSIREDSYEKITEVVNLRKMNPDPIQYYLDLRKFGTVPHGGFGLGLDRLVMLMTGMENVKDVVPFPVQYSSCEY